MEPIISPGWIYLTSLLPNVQGAFFVIGAIIAICSSITFFITFMEGENDVAKACLKILIFSAILILIAMFIPSQETLILMKAVEFVTPDNIDAAQTSFKDAVDYIVMALAAIK